MTVEFSWPGASDVGVVEATGFPESGAEPKTRFKGLFGEARWRDKGRVMEGLGRAERTESLMLGWNGVGVVVLCGKKEVASEEEEEGAGVPTLFWAVGEEDRPGDLGEGD